jgi:hypothetical protein
MALENSSTTTPSSALSIIDILSCISDLNALSIFKAVALSDNDCGDILITKLKLTRKQYYSNQQKLIDAGLMKKVNVSKYKLTSFGKVIFSCIRKVETAIECYWKLKAIDSITKMMYTNAELPAEEYQKIVDNIIDDDEIKDILVRRFCRI